MNNPHINNMTETTNVDNFHNLSDKWVLFAHLPHDTDWGINSYKKISTMATVEQAIAVTETLPPILIENCMLFLMRDGIKPIWEDPKNRNGGCFSYKVLNKNVHEVWKGLSYSTVGNTVSSQIAFVNNITGITISPKKNFCIVKIWLTNCVFQNPTVVTTEVKWIVSQGCIFTKFTPEY
jgi:hypothetical protein